MLDLAEPIAQGVHDVLGRALGAGARAVEAHDRCIKRLIDAGRETGKEMHRLMIAPFAQQPGDAAGRREVTLPLSEQRRLSGAGRRNQQHELAAAFDAGL